MIFAYIKYLLKAKGRHSIHSPFVYKLYTEVIKTKDPKNIFSAIENLRSQLLLDEKLLIINDMGAGSKKNKNKQRRIKDIAKNSLKSSKYASLLYRLAQFQQPKNILELGTSLGISTSYLSLASPTSRIVTLEGCDHIASKALHHFDQLQLSNIELIRGNIDQTLQAALSSLSHLDFAFFDANHTYEATLRYFNTCLPHANERSIFIIDDINWSKEMQMAWEKIIRHPDVSVSIDLFGLGLLLMKRKQVKEHFILNF